MERTLLFSKTAELSQAPQIAQQVAAVLQKSTDPFCLLLEGELGAGKTTLTRQLLLNLGLSLKTPVSSPTFSLIQEYEIGKNIYAHLDLYRIHNVSSGDDGLFLDPERYSGFFVEWGQGHETLFPTPFTHFIRITLPSEKTRLYEFFSLAH